MGYRILYDPEHNKKYPAKQAQHNSSGIVLGVALVALLAILWSVPKTNRLLKRFLIPGDPVKTEMAASAFIDDLRSGIGFRDAATVFCLEILDGRQEGYD